MAPPVKTYPRYLCRGRLYALSKFEITCVSCERKYHSTSHAYNLVIMHQCVQPHGGNNGKELFGLDAVAPKEMVAGRSEKLLQYIARYYVGLKFATSNMMQMNLLSNKLPLRRALWWLVREHRRKLTNRTKQVTDHLDTLGRMERWRSVLLPLKKQRLATEVQMMKQGVQCMSRRMMMVPLHVHRLKLTSRMKQVLAKCCLSELWCQDVWVQPGLLLGSKPVSGIHLTGRFLEKLMAIKLNNNVELTAFDSNKPKTSQACWFITQRCNSSDKMWVGKVLGLYHYRSPLNRDKFDVMLEVEWHAPLLGNNSDAEVAVDQFMNVPLVDARAASVSNTGPRYYLAEDVAP
ncbi:hypothetical protein VOLCADRAFT_87249 [Volvox carteri f. nagariensis]|uniref:Uncharacterized protein jtpnB9-2b n=1 Tax=Volvox carteri f. nagariensis TaxID=3068 RepID=D8TKJ3_VOLCA|nr:uncharacterized protein VOLCADRAFT_87249 [Volvox carteri f. nagariensis]EFJ52257.1 hypothetical protein VOLCADRAFT_87249 [Volvox carteri f. nagariensis]|eukprot:XP_002947031.1 hypothetical protein VOLCADRAFT_87249 [Volvox carteri f. nagariensis]